MDSNTFSNILQAIFLIPFFYSINQYIFKRLKHTHSFFDTGLMNKLFFYHLFFGGFYYIYAVFNRSDSHRYFSAPQKEGKAWLDYLGTETTIIDFFSYPLINGFGFSYEMMMMLFTWIGFLGFVYAYLFFKENIPLKVKVFKKVDLLTLILFLPNMHFWTASLGKGAPIFFGLMVFAYAICKPQTRITGLVIGSLVVFAIRPHVFLILAGGAVIGFMSGNNGVSWQHRMVFCLSVVSGLFMVQDQILAVVNLQNSENLIGDFVEFTAARSASLDNAGSGVNMAGYSLPEKIFTFWFRPLFFDSPGILGLFVSVENLIYLLLFLKLFKRNFFKFLKSAPVNVKMSLVIFLSTSFAMTFVMSNLGIIIRQKSMIMYFLFFVVYYFLASEKDNIPNLQLKVANSNARLPEAA
ncbi:hypothetical protein FK178_01870 [Antarcticibacterium arcticum]|uniref:Uncharacterized protein n=1 Tax=Antarcticibacterium arcticum TaxID=2585771 RepID=A0A5B8YI80_9FLAO|nr:hypothetical protein [Antarcticibacterium arcticum]QED36537.1 hypothetical protein FK178_01870 [Antarcticibacterium arcticum]